MTLTATRAALGVERAIWIDDVYGEPAEDLAVLAREQPEIQEEFGELAEAFAQEGFGDVDAVLAQAIADLEQDRLEQLRMKLLKQDSSEAPASELAPTTIELACDQLAVAPEDRWSFEQADTNIPAMGGNDANTAYIIDLKEGGGSERRGLEILSQLREVGSEGVAFILTHEAAISSNPSEADLEATLTDELGDAANSSPPLTVISKERLSEVGDEEVQTALAIALKRAGLRRALYRVATAASNRAGEAYASTASSLLKVEPERLERYVYERGRAEGVSELSVVERALSAGASKAVRTFFATDTVVIAAMQSLRALQSISLDNQVPDAGEILTALRDAEVWDDGDLINAAFTPLANGDVFKFDDKEPAGPNSPRRFVLLGQPCDIMLRADGKRVSEVAMLVPLTQVQEDGTPLPDPNDPEENEADKAPELPFRMMGNRFKLNLRAMAHARLAILDLACFRSDGCVRVEAGHGPSDTLLDGGKSIYEDRTSAANASLASPVPDKPAPGSRLPIDDRLMLTMSDSKLWSRIRVGERLGAYTPPHGHHHVPLPDRVTWHLRREGRIRSPYSAFLLERALRTLGRRAFDADFAD